MLRRGAKLLLSAERRRIHHLHRGREVFHKFFPHFRVQPNVKKALRTVGLTGFAFAGYLFPHYGNFRLAENWQRQYPVLHQCQYANEHKLEKLRGTLLASASSKQLDKSE